MRLFAAGSAAALALSVLAACSGDATDGPTDAPTATETTPGIACDYLDADTDTIEVVEAETPAPEPAWEGTVEATLATSVGQLDLSLDADEAPCAVNAVLSLAEQGFYDDTECHHLSTEEAFYLQCGDPTQTGSGSPPWVFADEVDGDETYPAGTVAMASGGADTNGSQFFIVYEDTPFGPDYTILGTLDDASLDLVRSVGAAGIRPGFFGAEIMPPATPVIIESFTIADG